MKLKLGIENDDVSPNSVRGLPQASGGDPSVQSSSECRKGARET